MRRRRIPGPDPVWETAAASAASRFRHLDTSSTARLLDHARELDRTRGWEGLGGLVLTSEMRAEIAVGAALLTVGIGLGALRDVTSILVGPSSTIRRTRHLVGGTLVTESDACVLGEALLHGPLRLAWDRVVADAVPGSTTSVVIHEFAHKIDMGDGVADGTPPIADRVRSAQFERAARASLERLGSGDESTGLRPYAATNRAELFAVASEALFLEPDRLAEGAPDLYRVLAGFYQQDPAGVMPDP